MWARVTITYLPTGYTQNYKRNIAAHNHAAQQNFVMAARADSLMRINAHLPPGHPAAVGANLGQHNLAVNLGNNPGPNWRLI